MLQKNKYKSVDLVLVKELLEKYGINSTDCEQLAVMCEVFELKSMENGLKKRIYKIIGIVGSYLITPIILYFVYKIIDLFEMKETLVICTLFIILLTGFTASIIALTIIFDDHFLSTNDVYKCLILKIKELQLKEMVNESNIIVDRSAYPNGTVIKRNKTNEKLYKSQIKAYIRKPSHKTINLQKRQNYEKN